MTTEQASTQVPEQAPVSEQTQEQNQTQVQKQPQLESPALQLMSFFDPNKGLTLAFVPRGTADPELVVAKIVYSELAVVEADLEAVIRHVRASMIRMAFTAGANAQANAHFQQAQAQANMNQAAAAAVTEDVVAVPGSEPLPNVEDATVIEQGPATEIVH